MSTENPGKPSMPIQTTTDYRYPLLWLMGELLSASTRDVISEFEKRFDDLIPEQHYESTRTGKIIWKNSIQWARQYLVYAGIMGSGGHGVWTITDAGINWLLEHTEENISELDTVVEKAKREKYGQPKSPQPSDSFYWRGKDWVVDREALLEQIKKETENGAPEEAYRYQTWYILADGKRVSPKWVFHLITGVDYSYFNTTEARDRLEKIGVEVKHIDDGKNKQNSAEKRKRRIKDRDKFFKTIVTIIEKESPGVIKHGEFKLFPGRNYMQIRYPEFPRSHYEVRLGREFEEIAFHFEGKKEDNHTRLQLFKPIVENIENIAGNEIFAEAWGSTRARIYIKINKWEIATKVLKILADSPSKHQIDMVRINFYKERLIEFVNLTYEPLVSIFNATKTRRKRRRSSRNQRTSNDAIHARLDIVTKEIRQVIQGKSERPSDERLCEWVYLCYHFDLFAEGSGLFELVIPDSVDEWLYKRTSKNAKICWIQEK